MTTTTTKLHDLAPMREELKTTAATVRGLRDQARQTSHDERHSLKEEAKSYAHWTRHELLAYGYLRGLSISEMESPFTINHASAREILHHAKTRFGGDEAAWEEFKAHVESDVKAWNNQCRLRVMQRAAQLAKKEVA